MQSGIIGLGCIDATLFRRLMRAGHLSMGWNVSAAGTPSASFTRFLQQRGFVENILSSRRFSFGGPIESSKK